MLQTKVGGKKIVIFLSEATWKDISSASSRLNWKEKENSRTDSVCLALNMYFIAKAVPSHVA